MNPIFVFLVLLGTALLWVLLSCIFRLIGSITERTIKNTKKALDDDSNGNIGSFVDGFKDSFKGDKKDE